MPFSQTDRDIEACRRLWQAVLIQAYQDLASPLRRDTEAGQSWVRWIGEKPEAAFVEVCELAEIDVERVHEALTEAATERVQRRRRRFELGVLPELAA